MIPELNRAWALLQRNDHAGALALAGGILAGAPDNPSALACHAMALRAAEPANPRAIEEMRRAIALAPRAPMLRVNLGNLLSGDGRGEEASEQFRAALELDPASISAFVGLSHHTRLNDAHELIARMEDIFSRIPANAPFRTNLAYALAKAFDDSGDPQKAIEYATVGGRLMPRLWDPERAQKHIDELRVLAASDAFRRNVRSGHPTRSPIFIVGMPRSGTTLIETILSRHPRVLALGESKQIPRLYDDARFRSGTASADLNPAVKRDWLAPRAERLVKDWQAQKPHDVVTDKMPDNSYMLGFIAQLFPKARIIYARRHPLDTGLSNFLTQYAEGQSYTVRQDWIGVRSRQLADTMALWKQALDLSILDISYELLVADPEPQIRRLASFAGLDWTDDFLTPEQSDRIAATASKWQVRQPIYKSSVARWKRYEPWLGSMIEAMGGFDWIEGEVAAAVSAGASA